MLQHIKNICERHYVDVCGPIGENGEKGQIIQVGEIYNLISCPLAIFFRVVYLVISFFIGEQELGEEQRKRWTAASTTETYVQAYGVTDPSH